MFYNGPRDIFDTLGVWTSVLIFKIQEGGGPMKGYNGVLSCSYRYSGLNRQDYEPAKRPLKKNTYSALNRCSQVQMDWEHLTSEIKYVSFCLSYNILYTFLENMQIYCLFFSKHIISTTLIPQSNREEW